MWFVLSMLSVVCLNVLVLPGDVGGEFFFFGPITVQVFCNGCVISRGSCSPIVSSTL